ncbi:hemagglutinin [Microbacterium sp. NEAU-LLC]|uniref:Hemagglutinin n=1 Tax=Microbacterium helvum TaxID=2773713 RepID=A0ABR8NLX2_9MICO|nr:hemagglutinin [Microbacterium helvum]MBD3941675.1 hemagglutinin [Microbacterium helvum]
MRVQRRRAGIAAAIVSCLVAATIIGTATSASAVVLGGFNIDGAVPDAGTTSYSDPNGNVKELGPVNASTTKIGVIHNDVPPTLDLTNPNAQVDLNTAWLSASRIGGKDYLYFAWARDKETGSGFIAYEFMKNAAPAACAYDTATQAQLIAGCNPWANRQAGDFLILWDQQGSSTTLYVRKWSGTAPNLVLGPATVLVAGTYSALFSPDGFRGEAAINLTDNGMGSDGSCLAFANVIPSTVTGNSDTADYKDTILRKISLSSCTSKTETVASTAAGTPLGSSVSIGTGVVEVKDVATVTAVGGNSIPTGDVTFSLCKTNAGACIAGTNTEIGKVALSNGAATSPSAWVTSVGTYCWHAVYSGSVAQNIPGSSDDGTNECFEVTPVTPTLSTTASDDVVLGNPVSDSASLGGTATKPTANIIETAAPQNLTPADGTITFTAYGPADDDCNGTPAFTSSAIPVSGNGTYGSGSFTPTAAGTYHWVATYSGSSPNTSGLTHNAACNDGNEDVTVTSVPSKMFTTQSWVPNDTVTVSASAGGDMAGTATFQLYKGLTCDGTLLYTSDPVTVAGPSPQAVSSANTVAVAAGDYSWKVSYDSTNPAQRDIAPSCHESSSLTVTDGGLIVGQ